MFLGAGLALAGSFGLGSALTRGQLVPWPVRFCAGAAGLSFLVFLLMTGGVAHRPALAALSLTAAALVAVNPPKFSLPRIPWWSLAVFAVYGAFYAWSATGPEIQADPNTYHLEAARDALREGRFSSEISFYNRLPQALELLFVIAYAFGGASAARLVHFAFLIATVPLIVAIGRRAGLPDYAAYGATALYFLSPVVAVTGTAAFNDAALVCATLAMLLVLLDGGPAWLAGGLAGFCYAIKMTGGLAIPVGLLILAGRKQWRSILPFGLAASVVIAPWLIRNAVETGNPFAPFFNAWFPNRYFHIATEQQISAALRNYGVSFADRFREVLWGGRLQGILGPVFVLAPLGLLALRRRGGMVLFALALLFSVPWWLNAGTRFLLTALPFVALCMTASLPRAGVIVLVGIQAVTAWPAAVKRYSPDVWILPGRMTLQESGDYLLAKMIESHTAAGDRIFDLYGVHAAHTDRRFTNSWQSAAAEVLLRGLEFAKLPGQQQLYEWKAVFPEQPVTGVRIRQTGTTETIWSVAEIELTDGDRRVPNSRRWSLDANPNRWELPLAFDRNYASRWMAWQHARPDQWIAVDFEDPETLTGVAVVGTIWDGLLPLSIELRSSGGAWATVPADTALLPPADLRRPAIQKLRSAGFRYVVASGELRAAFLADPAAWGVSAVGDRDGVTLLRIL